MWRSLFHYDKPVKHTSSASLHYYAPFFPPSPSLAGSVMSRDLAIYLTHNMNFYLHGFDNIANSLAIWLAPVSPSYYDEQDWLDSYNSNISKGLVLIAIMAKVDDERFCFFSNRNRTNSEWPSDASSLWKLREMWPNTWMHAVNPIKSSFWLFRSRVLMILLAIRKLHIWKFVATI